MHQIKSTPANTIMNIHIGEYLASKKPIVIHTLLGSCVSACLFDPVSRIGGMNHIFLPGEADFECFNDCARFGVNAMELLINDMLKLGARKNNLVAKVFGGSSTLPSFHVEDHIGKKNSEFLVTFLDNESIRIVASNLGGNTGKKIYFSTYTGDVLLKHLKPMVITELRIKDKKKAEERRIVLKTPGEITLL